MQNCKNIQIPKEQIGIVITMFNLRSSFESVGHFFRGIINNEELPREFINDSIIAKFDAFKYRDKALHLRKVGNDLLDKLLLIKNEVIKIDRQKLKIAFMDAAEVNTDAAFIVNEFIEHGLSEKLDVMALENWDLFIRKDLFFLAPFYGRIENESKLFIFELDENDVYVEKWKGRVRLRYHISGKKVKRNWSIESVDRNENITLAITFALPGWVHIEVPLDLAGSKELLVFKFPPIIKRDELSHPDFESIAFNTVRKKQEPNWKAVLTAGYVRGDLTLTT